MPHCCCPNANSVFRILLVAAALSQGAIVRAEQSADFDRTVAPILAVRCLECHSGADPGGGLDLSHVDLAMKGGDSGEVIVRRDPSASLLWERIDSDEMPPEHPLDASEKIVIKDWIENGAEWGTSLIDPFAVTTPKRAGYDWWSLQPLKQTAPPETDSDEWIRNDIDAFVLRRLREAGLRPSGPSSPRALVRRLYFDLIGLPPDPETVAVFASNPSEKAYQELVDDLLMSEHYGERWGRHWLDVVRFGESGGFERNRPRMNAWPYRDWVINAFNRDMPYDEFVRCQLIGDQLNPGYEGAAATGFWVAGVHNTVVGRSERMRLLARQDELEEVIAAVGQTFLGLTVNCARCHDHKFDPIKQKEFYQLTSAISGLGFGERTAQTSEQAAELNQVIERLSTVMQQMAAIEQRARREIIASRSTDTDTKSTAPAALARWEFDTDFSDSSGNLHGSPHGDVRIENGSVILNGSSFVSTPPVPKDITAKTLTVWVQLDNLMQRGGGAISIETKKGRVFDSIVFAENEPGRWMPGSNGFVRTNSFRGPVETEAVSRPVHMAYVYAEDGTITGYRDGVRYGDSVRKGPIQKYTGEKSRVIFGLRHTESGKGFLSGRIHRAALYDRALSAEEIAAAASSPTEYVTEKQITEWIPQTQRDVRRELLEQARKLTKHRNRLQQLADRKLYTLVPQQGAKMNVLLRGDPYNIGEPVQPSAVAAVRGIDSDFHLAADAPEESRRRQLAAWITDPSNPLFPRIIVNRIWHYHFGTGLVDTPNDFGFNGGRPSHPELLEWLAVHFRDSGFRMKDFHRLLVTSGTYRQAAFSPESDSGNGADVDAGNRLLWRMTPRRLEAECVRDAMLAVSGTLNTQAGGPGFVDVSIVSNNGTTYYTPVFTDSEDTFRRTVYRFNPRGGRSALLDTFDCPDSASTAPRRAVTTTPLQALSLLNNSFVLHMSALFAERVRKDVGDAASDQVSRAWQLAVARLPTDQERQLSLTLVSEHGLPALCRGLFNTSEFVLIE
ncbi:MAG: DUF1553 domain-containing protein [Fuerstiella sp.]|nr:DUF1553 domain-containing protein [Fuerstiella sp.]